MPNDGGVLQLLNKILWRKQVRGFGNGHTFTVSCSCREGTRRLLTTSNESRMETRVVKIFYQKIYC